jgi:hypothetical protein
VVGSSEGAGSVVVLESEGVGESLGGCGSAGRLATGSDVTGSEELGALDAGALDDGALDAGAEDVGPEEVGAGECVPLGAGGVVLRDGVVEVADAVRGDGRTCVGRTNAGEDEGARSGAAGVARCFGALVAVVPAVAAAPADAGASATARPPGAATAATA